MKLIVNFHCLTKDLRLFTLPQGLDATTVFQDIGHSAEALKILAKYYIGELREVRIHANTTYIILLGYAGADPGFFLGGVALVSCSTSTSSLQKTSCIRKPQVISGGGGGGGMRTHCALPLDPPLLCYLYLMAFWPVRKQYRTEGFCSHIRTVISVQFL